MSHRPRPEPTTWSGSTPRTPSTLNDRHMSGIRGPFQFTTHPSGSSRGRKRVQSRTSAGRRTCSSPASGPMRAAASGGSSCSCTRRAEVPRVGTALYDGDQVEEKRERNRPRCGRLTRPGRMPLRRLSQNSEHQTYAVLGARRARARGESAHTCTTRQGDCLTVRSQEEGSHG